MNRIVYTGQALKDLEKLKALPALHNKLIRLVELLKENPFKNPPPYEKLSGKMESAYSRRINKQHRLVYQVLSDTVKIIRMWTHY